MSFFEILMFFFLCNKIAQNPNGVVDLCFLIQHSRKKNKFLFYSKLINLEKNSEEFMLIYF